MGVGGLWGGGRNSVRARATLAMLRENGRDPGFLIGGVPLDPPVGNHLGTAEDPFVIEGDEYDSAFFDKRSKFIHYAPQIAVLNNLEFDHADIFRDLADVQRTFAHLTRIVPRRGCVVVNGDDANLAALGPLPWTRVIRVGTGEHNDLRIADFAETPAGARFALIWRGTPWAEIAWTQPGLFNARNAAMAATAAGLALAMPRPAADVLATADTTPAPSAAELDPRGIRLDALARFRGVKRRQETLLATPALTVIEDFGHHPTALAETLRSFRARFPGARITAVFEPRSNTARTKTLQGGFVDALALADEAWLGAVNRAEKLAAAERFDVEAVRAELAARGCTAVAAPSNAALLDELLARVRMPAADASRLVVFFTNGSFDGIIGKFVATMRVS